jgi:hypothetical protein
MVYSDMSGPEEVRAFARHLRDIVGNKRPQPGVYPDYSAAIVRNAPDGVRERAIARWGVPSTQIAPMEATKKRAALEAKGKPVDFNHCCAWSRTQARPTSPTQLALAARAWRRKPLRRALQFVQREQGPAGWFAAAGLVRLQREPVASFSPAFGRTGLRFAR